jgi:uncharacterized membrane protein YozB (DUF420 family)
MSTASATRLAPQTGNNKLGLIAKILTSTVVIGLAVAFVGKYVFHYYLNYSEAGFTAASPKYWIFRWWLLLHISGGTLALLCGPWQFWTGFRARYLNVHRWMGRLFLLGVVMGSIGAFRMSVDSAFGWAFGVSLFVLATAWLTSAAMAYYAIRRRRVDVHKDWMLRAYIITFGFVMFRILDEYSPLAHLQPATDRIVIVAWLCWTVPLLISEVTMQLRRMR